MARMVINRGSDLTFTMNWKQPGGTAPYDLTGATVAAFEPHPSIAGHITLTVTDAAQGAVSGRVEWQDDMPTGRVMHFRVRVSIGSDDTSTGKIWVTVK